VPIKTGSYAPDGTDNWALTGVGFQPDFVLVQRTGTYYGVIAHKDMTSGNSFQWGSTAAALTDGVKSLDGDGVTLGTNADVNASGTTYYYLAIKAEPGLVYVGSYTGAGASDKAVTGVGFQPCAVWVKCISGTVRTGAYGTATATAAGYSFNTGNTAGPTPAHLKSLDADGFTALASSNPWNTSGGTHVYVAFKGGTNVFGEGKYTGDGSSPKTVSGAGFQPSFGWASSVGAQHKYLRNDTMAASSSKPIANVAASTAYTTGFHADGITVSTNINTASTDYYWQALRDSPLMPSVTTGLGALDFSGYAQSLALPAPVLGSPRELRFTGHAPAVGGSRSKASLLSYAMAEALR
jgi:hypothetical protein